MKLFMLRIFLRLFFSVFGFFCFFKNFFGTALIENSSSVSEKEVREKCYLTNAEFLHLFY